MAVKFTTTRDSVKTVNALVYGPSGVGKTRLCATLQKPVIISSEKGCMSIAKYNIPVLGVKTVADLQEATRIVQTNKHGFIECCVDSITDIADSCLSSKKAGAKDPRKAFYDAQDEVMQCLRDLRDLEISTYVVAQHDLIIDQAGLSTNMPSMPSRQMTTKLPYMFDVVMAMRISPEGKRTLLTQLTNLWYAKDRSESLKIIEKPNLSKIFKKIERSIHSK